jgi:hypothetical protein
MPARTRRWPRGNWEQNSEDERIEKEFDKHNERRDEEAYEEYLCQQEEEASDDDEPAAKAPRREKSFDSPHKRLAHYLEVGSFVLLDCDAENASAPESEPLIKTNHYAVYPKKWPDAANVRSFRARFAADLRRLRFVESRDANDEPTGVWTRAKWNSTTKELELIDMYSMRTPAEEEAYEAELCSRDCNPFCPDGI